MAQTVELGTDGAPRVPAGSQGGSPGGPDPHGSLIGKSLLQYRVLEMIGQGGMSVVYRGRDENLHRDVAIKVLHPFLAEKAECRARLAREARAVARLEHPHVLKVFDFSGDPDTIDEKPGGASKVRGFAEGFIIAELVRGPTLKRYVEEHELWKMPEVGAMVVWQIATALEHAHKNGVVHRDIKPENVMVREDGWLKLMDFGIAQIADQKGLTITGTLLGSPAHMAPECIDGHAADERSDLFSLGTVLYWITTGCLPFEALTPHALLKQIVEGRSLPAQQRSPRISDDLARVIAKSMATKPSDRYENAGAFVAALVDLLEKSGLPADSGRLRDLLAHPEKELAGATAAVRAAFLKRAEQHIADGNPARALSCLNRVLAEDKDDAAARALVEKAGVPEDPTEITGDDEVLPASLVNAPLIAANQNGTPLPGSLGPGLLTTSPTTTNASLVEPPRLGRLIQQAAVVVGAVALIAIAVVLATRFDADRFDADRAADNNRNNGGGDGTKLADKARGHEGKGADDVNSGTTSGSPDEMELGKVDNGGKARDGANGTGSDDTKKRAKDPKGVGKLVVNDPRNVLPPGDVVAPPPPALVTRSVKFRVKPWSDISVDGVVVARGVPQAQLDVAVGPHKVKFHNPAGKDVDKDVTIAADGQIPDVIAEIEPRPALLVVTCDQPDALVSVANGGGAKTAGETVGQPLIVPLSADWRASLEVTVYKKGLPAVVKPVVFSAGQTSVLDVKLGAPK